MRNASVTTGRLALTLTLSPKEREITTAARGACRNSRLGEAILPFHRPPLLTHYWRANGRRIQVRAAKEAVGEGADRDTRGRARSQDIGGRIINNDEAGGDHAKRRIPSQLQKNSEFMLASWTERLFS